MSNYNHVTLVGVVDEEITTKQIGKQFKTSMALAVERFAGKDQEPVIDKFNIISWGKLAEVCADYLKKGKKVLVDGRIQIRSFKEDGEQKWITEVVAENLKFLSTPVKA